jgi:hypothetical protein
MGKKSTPAAPDYTAAAQQTAASSAAVTNQQTYANRADQVTPWGTQSWQATPTVDPATGQAVSKWTQTTTLSPEQQKALTDQQAIQSQRSDIGLGLMGRVQQEYGTAMDWGSLPDWASTPTASNTQAVTNPYGFNPNSIDTSRASTPSLQTNLGQQGPIQQGLDYSHLNGVQTGAQNTSNAANAAYSQATSRLDPQWQHQQQDLETQLANQGITRNSDAYTRAMQDFGNSKNDAYNQANMSAIQAGVNQGQTQYGEDMGIRQQQAAEQQQQGSFSNQAQQQAYEQALNSGQFGNQALSSQFGLGQQASQAQLAAQQAQQQLGLANQQQGFNQQLQSSNQNYGQQSQSAAFQNQLRNQQLTEAMQKRGFSLNEIQALLNGQQVGMPQFSGYNTAAASQATDYSGAAQNQYQAGMDAYNAQAQQSQAMMSAAGGLAGSAMMFSDRRVKTDVRRIGTHRSLRVGIYSYRYIGERGRRVGVMAQELRRKAPHLVDSVRGVLRVNYAALGLREGLQ